MLFGTQVIAIHLVAYITGCNHCNRDPSGSLSNWLTLSYKSIGSVFPNFVLASGLQVLQPLAWMMRVRHAVVAASDGMGGYAAALLDASALFPDLTSRISRLTSFCQDSMSFSRTPNIR